MKMTLIGIIALILISLLIYSIKKLLTPKLTVVNKQNSNNQDYSAASVADVSNALSLQEKLELSWQFLYKITDIVLKRFSKDDQKVLHDAAKTLVENGMTYEHVIDYAITKNDYIALAEKKKSTELQR